MAQDPTFDARHFLTGARAAYEMIVTAYAQGDRRTLKNLLSKEVYDGFEAAMNEYRAALTAGGDLPEVKAAAERGLQQAYEPPAKPQ